MATNGRIATKSLKAQSMGGMLAWEKVADIDAGVKFSVIDINATIISETVFSGDSDPVDAYLISIAICPIGVTPDSDKSSIIEWGVTLEPGKPLQHNGRTVSASETIYARVIDPDATIAYDNAVAIRIDGISKV